MRIQAFDYFRAIAIIFIVAGHCYGFWQRDTVTELTISNLITGGTSLFVFISGFFFHYVFYKKFNYLKFMQKKIQNVFVPYLILSLSLILVAFISTTNFPGYERFFNHKVITWTDHLELTFFYLFIKGAFAAYWYIPFIMLVFLASPLFLWFIKISNRSQIVLIAFTLILSMIIHRPEGNLFPLQSLLYFTPVYLIGIYVSINREKFMHFLSEKTWYLLLLVISLAMYQALFYDTIGNFEKADMFTYTVVDILILQKIAMSFFFLALLSKFENHDTPVLKKLADISFSLFFLHGIVIFMLNKISYTYYLEETLNTFVYFVLYFSTVMTLSITIAYTIKWILKNRSRYVIGW